MKSRVQAPAVFRSGLSGAAFWIALFAVLTVFGLSSVSLRAESANTFFKRGQTAETREDYDAAFDNYQKAYTKDPKAVSYTHLDVYKRQAPSMAAPPAISVFISSILLDGLMEMPPESKVMPLPTRPRIGPSFTPSGS